VVETVEAMARSGTDAEPALVVALAMLVGRGRVARTVLAPLGLGPTDRCLDVGCGPGAAARWAARRAAAVTGVDPSRPALWLAGRISRLRRVDNVTWQRGTAEALLLPDTGTTAAWAISALHHWEDVPAGLGELYRVVAPGGRILVAERLVKPGQRQRHGRTLAEAGEVAARVAEAGFADVRTDVVAVGRRSFVLVQAARP
jgi:SAM-dependent methyltransferase